MLSSGYFNIGVEELSKKLLGDYIVKTLPNNVVLKGKIVETEAYHESDPACHAYKNSLRSRVMFGPPGRAYVYFTYGMHHCLNVVAGKKGEGSAVLIRALEPTEGIEIMKINRQNDHLLQLCNGPAKLNQAFGIDLSYNEHDLRQEPLQLIKGEEIDPNDIVTTTRIGISKSKDLPLRFYIKNNQFISKK